MWTMHCCIHALVARMTFNQCQKQPEIVNGSCIFYISANALGANNIFYSIHALGPLGPWYLSTYTFWSKG